MCHSCYLKNQRQMKRNRDEKEGQKIDEAKMVRLDDANVNVRVEELEVLEMADVAEKEGTAVSVLLYLSKL
jgi:hypothetical protein